MISNNDFALIAALDLNPIKTKLMHKESGEGWSWNTPMPSKSSTAASFS